MNRIVLVPLCLGALAACTGDITGAFEHSASLNAEVSGMAVVEDGQIAHVGMLGSTCDINTASGMIGSDYDFPGPKDVVVEAGVVDGVQSTLVISEQGLHLQDVSTWQVSAAEVLAGVIDARLTDRGTVALVNSSGCEVTWSDGQSVAVSASACEAGTISADRTSGSAFIATDQGVIRVSPQEQVVLGIDGELIAWDGVADVLYVTQVGDVVVHGLNSDGTQRWSTEVPGNITALSTLGDRGAALIAAQTFSGSGLILELDGESGAIRSQTDTPTAAAQLTAAQNGNTVAVASQSMVHFLSRR